MAMYAPQEIEFDGILYRSKNEARWACFFDLAGIEFEYEPRMFFGRSGIKYRPDFYFPKYGKYGEVKSTRDALHEESMARKLEAVIDYGATDVSNGLLLLGAFPYDVRIKRGLWLEAKWLYCDEGVCCGSASFYDSSKSQVEWFISIDFKKGCDECGSPLPKSADPEILLHQCKYDDSCVIYDLITKANNIINDI